MDLVKMLKLDTEKGRRRMLWFCVIVSFAFLMLGYALILFLLLK